MADRALTVLITIDAEDRANAQIAATSGELDKLGESAVAASAEVEAGAASTNEAIASTATTAKVSADEVAASGARSSEALVATGVAAGSAAGDVEEASTKSKAALDDVAEHASSSGALVEGALAGGGAAAGKASKEIEEGGTKTKTVLSDVGTKAESSSKSLKKFGDWGTAAVVGVAAGVVDLGVKFQSATTAMAAQGDIPIKVANDIGKSFLNSKDDVIFGAKAEEEAYGSVVGQLSTLKGYTDNASTATKFMATSMDLAEESGSTLSSTTSDLSKLMQTFQIPIKDVTGASTDLFNASRLTGTGIDQVSSSLSTLKSRLGVTAPSLSALSSLSVDFAEHGLSGSKALRQVNTAMTTLLKPQNDLLVSNLKLTQATANLPPSLQALSQEYDNNTISATQLETATEAMTPAQQAAWSAFTSASTAVINAKNAIQLTGITVDNAKGQFAGMGNIITQVDAKLKGHTQAQQLAILSTILGTSANKAMLETFLAGSAGIDKATKSVTNSSSAHNALTIQQKTLGHEFEATKVEVDNLATRVGVDLIPKLEELAKDGGEVLSFFEKNKLAAEVLAGVIGTVLAGAVAVFTEQKLTKMIAGVKEISSGLSTLAQKAGSAAEKFLGLGGASESATSKLQSETAAAKGASTETGAAGTAASETGAAGAAGAAGTEGSTAEVAGSLGTAADALTASAGDLSEAAAKLSLSATTQETNAENDSELDASDSADVSSAAADLVGAAGDLTVAATKLALSGTVKTPTTLPSEEPTTEPPVVVPPKGTTTEAPAETPAGEVPETAPSITTAVPPETEGLFAAGLLKGSLATGIGGLIGVQLYNAFLEKDVGKVIGTKAASVIGDTATGAALGAAVAGPVGIVIGGVIGAAFSQRKDLSIIRNDNADIARDKKEDARNEKIIKVSKESPEKIYADAVTKEAANSSKAAAEKQLLAADQTLEVSNAASGVPSKSLEASAAHLQASITHLSAANHQISATASTEIAHKAALKDQSKEAATAATATGLSATQLVAAASDHKDAAKDTSKAATDLSKASSDLISGNTKAATSLELSATNLNKAAVYLDKLASAGISPPSSSSMSAPKRHASGGVTTGASTGEIGEAGTEAILPLTNPSAMAQIATAIAAAGGAGGGLAGSHQTIYQIQELTIVAQNPAQMEQQLAQKARVSALSGRPSGASNLAVAT